MRFSMAVESSIQYMRIFFHRCNLSIRISFSLTSQEGKAGHVRNIGNLKLRLVWSDTPFGTHKSPIHP